MDLEKIVRQIPVVDWAMECHEEKSIKQGTKKHVRNSLAKSPVTRKKFENQLKYEDYQEKSKNLILGTESYMRRIDKSINDNLKTLKKHREEIHKKLFVRASEITEKIVIKDYKNNIKLRALKYDLEKYAPGNKLLNNIEFDMKRIVSTGPVPGYFTNLISDNLKTKRELIKAEVEYERVKAECQRIKAQYARKKATVKALENTNMVIEALSNMLNKSEDNVEEIIASKGKKIDMWNDEEISAVRTMFNLLGVLSDILHTDPFTKNGNLTTAYKNLIGDAQKEYIGEANE